MLENLENDSDDAIGLEIDLSTLLHKTKYFVSYYMRDCNADVWEVVGNADVWAVVGNGSVAEQTLPTPEDSQFGSSH